MKKTMPQLFTLLVLSIAAFVYRLFIITKLWTIIAVPLGMQPLSLLGAWGIGVLATVLVSDFYHEKREMSFEELLKSLITNAVVITIGWGLVYLMFP